MTKDGPRRNKARAEVSSPDCRARPNDRSRKQPHLIPSLSPPPPCPPRSELAGRCCSPSLLRSLRRRPLTHRRARRTKWKQHQPYAHSPLPRPPQREPDPAVLSRPQPRGSPGRSRRRLGPAPSPPPARRWWSPALRRRPRRPPRTPRPTAPAASAAPAPPGSSRCEFRPPLPAPLLPRRLCSVLFAG